MSGYRGEMSACASLAYEQWQDRLARRYFGHDHAGRPVLLFMSDDEVAQMGDPADLASAVGAKLTCVGAASPFTPVELDVERWKLGDREEPPPCLPLLAVTVLAATRMHRDELAAPHAYYIRLAELLRPGAYQGELDRLRDRLSQWFEDVVSMWLCLHSWLELNGGLRGVSTIRTGGSKRRIGYALSQALVRTEDRNRLTEFFAALNLTAESNLGETALLHYLRLWATRPRGLSPRLLEALECDADATPLGAVLASLADGWDGIVRERAGLRRASLRACADVEAWSVWWELEQVPQVDEDVLLVNGGGEIKAVSRDGYLLYELSGDLPDIGRALRQGMRAAGTRMAVYAPGAEVVAMRRDPVAGAWATEPCITPYEEHVLLVAPPAEAEVLRALKVAAAPGWKLARSTLVQGWVTYLNVIFASPSALEQVTGSVREAVALVLRPDAGIRPTLCHGLQVKPGLGRHLYLAGGEPDLLLPAGPEPRMVRAVLDGQESTFRAAGFPIPLRVLGPLPDGRRNLLADDTDLSFTVVSTLGTEAAGVDPAGDAVQGAWAGTGGLDPEPVLVRRGLLAAYAILSSGAIEAITEPPVPSWLETQVGPAAAYRFEYTPPLGCAWVAEQSRIGWTVRALGPFEPAIHALSPQARQVWGDLLRALPRADSNDSCWRRYLSAAGRCLGR